MSTSRMSSTRALPDDEIARVGHGLHVHRQLLELVDDLETTPAGNGRQCQQHTRHAEFFDQSWQTLRRMNLEAVDDCASQRRVVVDERNGHELSAPDERRHKMRAGLAGSVNNRRGRPWRFATCKNHRTVRRLPTT